jgi:triosephosphate isomerase
MTVRRRPVIAGNWKMNKTRAETRAYFNEFLPRVADLRHCDILIAPPYTALADAVQAVQGTRVRIAAQNVHWEAAGAFTGEISAAMLAEAGCTAVLVGHSERRQLFGETDQMVSHKARAAVAAGLEPIVCVGETLAEREAGRTAEVLTQQFRRGPGALTPLEFSRIMLAYEPVWAIGTGRTATPSMAAEAHRLLRSLVSEQFGARAGQRVRILYGGSVRPDNAAELLSEEEIDGLLVGTASLDPVCFAQIVACSMQGA